MFRDWADVPATVRASGVPTPADGYQLKVLSVGSGDPVLATGEDDARRLVFGHASTLQAHAERQR